MKKLLATLCIAAMLMPTAAFAGSKHNRHHNRYNQYNQYNQYNYYNHHHNNNNVNGWAVGAGVLGGLLLGEIARPRYAAPEPEYIQQCYVRVVPLYDEYSGQYIQAQRRFCELVPAY